MKNLVPVPGWSLSGWLRLNGLVLALVLKSSLLTSATPATASPEVPVSLLAAPTLPLRPPNVQLSPLPSVVLNRFDNDPLLFSLHSNKTHVTVGEDVELTVTVRYVHLSPTVRFLSEGTTGYALKLLLPAGFVADDNPLQQFARGWLSGTRPEQTFVVRGRFVRSPGEATFRLLRGHHDADEHSLFTEKARLTLSVQPGDGGKPALREASNGTTRQLIYNASDGNRTAVQFAKDHHFTAVGLWDIWYNLNPAPGVYRWDSLRVSLNSCRRLGLKAQVHIALRRQYNSGGRPQDHESFFPESAIMRYNDGSHSRHQPILDRYDVVPSLSSPQGMAAVETFMKAASAFLKPYFEDGTLLNVLAITGQHGELNYPIDDSRNPTLWTDYSQPALNEYRTAFLPARYGTIAALNQAWGTGYGGFNEVAYPIGPTPNDPYPAINSESRRDWIRFGIRKIADLTRRCRSALQTESPIPFSYLASEMTGYFYSIGFRSTNIPYMAGALDGIYTSAGTYQGDMDAAKLAWVDIIKGTLGKDKVVEIEFDNDDLSSQPNSFDAVGLLRSLGGRFYEKGGEYLHVVDLGNFNWGAVEPHLKYLRETYCTAPNNLVTPRAPQATGSYDWTKTFTEQDPVPFNVWRSLGGPNRQVDVRCVDDFNIDALTPPSTPVPAPPADVPCTRPAALMADSPVSLTGELQLKASFDGATAEPAITYRWTRPDGTTATNQTYSFGSLATAPKGIYSFKAMHSTGAACLRVNLTSEGISILD